MAGFLVPLPDLVIPNGAAASNVIHGCDDAEAFIIIAPAALTNTITLQVAIEGPPSDGEQNTANFATLQSGGSDITIPATKAMIITDIAYRQLKLVSSGNEGSTRTFKVAKQIYA